MFGKGGWLFLLWGILLLPIGFGIQAIGLLASRTFARRRSLLFLVGVLLIGTPDGAEIVNLTAAVLLSIAFVHYGLELIRGEGRGYSRPNGSDVEGRVQGPTVIATPPAV